MAKYHQGDVNSNGIKYVNSVPEVMESHASSIMPQYKVMVVCEECHYNFVVAACEFWQCYCKKCRR
ncbi:hypothetical protein VCRA213O314_300010 [Vibrio crassostreae]|nr:hypothetical protein VCRA213O314_300010 [Vibrio crassostreae]